ncbi:MAG: zinc-dependent alcohol dehydrogenase family protein [Chloroflexi bacterium]|nr:MAG: zinc-dependent alcohol dehydrogenase family protein [Chloroflexota bacterium]
MRAAIFNGPHDITVADVSDPSITAPTDAVVRVVLACVCGSDLWFWRGQTPHDNDGTGHEFIGVVEAVGSAVTAVREGDFVIAPFAFSDGTCPNCLAGIQTACVNGGFFGGNGVDGAQAERVRVPQANGTLVKVPAGTYDDATMRSLLTLSDVMGTGHHAAVSAGVTPGDTVAVVGDGAVGLSAVLAAKRLGAGRIIALSRNPSRQALAREFGASEIVEERGDDAVEAVRGLTGGIGADAALECVGTDDAVSSALAIARPGSTVGYVGVPHGVELSVPDMFYRNVGLKGGPAPVRAYIPELLEDVLAGRIDPGRVFDYETDLDHIADAYRAMDERRAIKSLIRVGAI